MREFYVPLSQLTQKVHDAMTLAGSEAYVSGLTCYGSSKEDTQKTQGIKRKQKVNQMNYKPCNLCAPCGYIFLPQSSQRKRKGRKKALPLPNINRSAKGKKQRNMKNRNLLAICALIVCMPNISSQKIVEQIDIFSDSIALSEYFYINTHYSLMNYINKAEGFVTCQFDTDSVGRIDNLQIINSNGNETLLEIEAKRLIYSIPIQKRDINTTHKVTVNFKWEDNQIFQMGAIEEQPEFPGGNTEMMKFISQNLRWPTEAAEMSIQGKVICGFVVEKDGSINIIEIARSVYHLLDAEALRVIGRMPKWKAGKHNGKPVRVYFLLPISFRMQDNP